MFPLEWLSITKVIGPASGIANVTDGSTTRVLPHDVFAFPLMIEPESFDDGPELLVGFEKPLPLRVIGRHACSQLPAVLQVKQHPRHQPGDLFRSAQGELYSGRLRARKVVNRRNSAFMVEFAHADA